MQVILSISGHQHTFDLNFAFLPVLLYQNIKESQQYLPTTSRASLLNATHKSKLLQKA